MCIDQAAHYALAGHSVAWFYNTGGSDVIDALAGYFGDEAIAICRTNGQASIDTRAGGKITFHSTRIPASIRGREIDLAVIPDWHLVNDKRFMADLLPAFGHNQQRIAVTV